MTGCNTHTFDYYRSSGNDIAFGPVLSTRIACPNDIDKFFIDGITKSDKIEQFGYVRFTLSDSWGNRIHATKTSVGSSFAGTYEINLPEVALKITPTHFDFQGCFGLKMAYTASNDGSISFSEPLERSSICDF